MTAATELPRILIVDDDAEVRDLIAEYFGRNGLEVSLADSAAEARDVLANGTVAVAVIDVAMPGEDGLSLTRFIRERLNVGIVMLTAADQPIDRIVGLAVGADDYVVKPFHPRELLMRVRAVLGRCAGGLPAIGEAGSATIGRFRLDPAAHALFDAHGAVVPLAPMELALLRVFVRHPHQSLSRQRLLELAGTGADARSERNIDLQVARLRRKVEQEPRRPKLIRTVRDCGYMFVPDAADDGG